MFSSYRLFLSVNSAGGVSRSERPLPCVYRHKVTMQSVVSQRVTNSAYSNLFLAFAGNQTVRVVLKNIFFSSGVICRFLLLTSLLEVTVHLQAMLRKEERNSIIEICPVRNVIARFGNKWALLVVLVLSEHEKVRFNELCRLIPDVSSRVLSGTLKTLEADALVSRTVYPVVPPKVEYRLTELGRSLVPLIAQLTEWAQTNIKKIVEHRRQFESEEASGK